MKIQNNNFVQRDVDSESVNLDGGKPLGQYKPKLEKKKIILIFISCLLFSLSFLICYLVIFRGNDIKVEQKDINKVKEFEIDGEVGEKDQGDIQQFEDEESGWRIYKNTTYGLKIKYPIEWESLELVETLNPYQTSLQESFIFETKNSLIEKVYYHKPTNTLVAIAMGNELTDVYDNLTGKHIEDMYTTEIILFDQEGLKEIVYTCPPYTVGRPYFNCSLTDLNFSPNARFIDFTKWGFESFAQVLVDTFTKEVIFDSYYEDDSWDCWIKSWNSYKKISWEKESSTLFVFESYVEIGDSNPEFYACIWVSDYQTPEKLNLVFSIPEEDYGYGNDRVIGEVKILDEKTLYFKEFPSRKEYYYDIIEKEFKN